MRKRRGGARTTADAIASEEHEPAAPRRHDHEVHDEQHQVVMPAVRPPAPESDLPHEHLLLDRAEHDEDQPHRGELGEDPERHAHAARHFRGAQKHREPGARPDALGSLGGVPQMIAPAVEERSEEHTSELQSHSDLVCRLLLEKKIENFTEREPPLQDAGHRFASDTNTEIAAHAVQAVFEGARFIAVSATAEKVSQTDAFRVYS